MISVWPFILQVGPKGWPAFNLYYDEEYKEEIAVFESCFAIKKSIDAEGIDVRKLSGGCFLSCLHHEPYATI